MLPGVHGPSEEHDIPVRPRHLPDVRRPDARVSDLPEADREANPSVLRFGIYSYVSSILF